jgi:hypothetical protein
VAGVGVGVATVLGTASLYVPSHTRDPHTALGHVPSHTCDPNPLLGLRRVT